MQTQKFLTTILIASLLMQVLSVSVCLTWDVRSDHFSHNVLSELTLHQNHFHKNELDQHHHETKHSECKACQAVSDTALLLLGYNIIPTGFQSPFIHPRYTSPVFLDYKPPILA